MTIESLCPGCGSSLRVADEHAGQQARCPACQTIYVVPYTTHREDVPVVAAVSNRWYMRTPDGRGYGPVARRELEEWHQQGRVGAGCEIRSDEDPVWRTAAHLLPPLPPSREPHRGGLILALGILTWVACPLFGILAWVLGEMDLRAMREGRMDPQGESLTQIGRILGMAYIMIVLAFVVLVFGVLLLGIVVA